MVLKVVLRSGEFREFGVEPFHRFPEQHVGVGVLGAVGMQLDEAPVVASLNRDARIDPLLQPSYGRWSTASQVAVLDPRQHAPFARPSSLRLLCLAVA